MAGRRRAIVIGGGVSGLVWALDAVEAGLDVTVLEREQHLGGVVRQDTLGPVVVDVGAESFALTRPDMLELIERLGLGAEVERPTSHQAHVLTGDRCLPLPPGLLGIPAEPDDIATLLGPAIAAEAVERDAAPLAAAAPATIGELVRVRLGDAITETLVDPVIAGVHATRADAAELASVAPTLLAAVHAHGGLMPAVRVLRGALGPAGSPVATLTGGMSRLIGCLEERIRAQGGLIRTEVEAIGLTQDAGAWQVRTPEGTSTADVLCLAVSARIAGRLLEGLGPSRSAALTATLAALPTTHDVTLVTLLLEDRALTLAGAPVGSGVLVADGPVRAKAMTHASAKWGWLAAALPSDHHVVRLSYGGTDPAADLPTDDASDLLRVALEDLHRLLAGSLGSPIVRAALVTPWRGALSRPVVGRAARIAALDRLVTEWSGLAVTGSAVAGNGLAGVVGRSRREAARTLAVRSDRAPGPTSIPRSP